MVAATLVKREAKVPLCIVPASPGAAEMDDRSQVLLLLERHRSLCDYSGDITVEQRCGQLDGVAWQDPRVEAVEPTGVEVVPWPVFNDHMVVDTVAFPFLKRAVGDLEHADRRRGRLVPFQRIRRDDAPSPIGPCHRIAGAFGLGQCGKQLRCNDGCRMGLEQRAVFLPRLAGILAERLLHWKEQFRRFIERVINPIDSQEDNEEQEYADSQPCRRWRSTDGPEKHAEILPAPVREARHRP